MDTPSPFPSTPAGRLNQIEALEEAQRRAPLSPVVTKYIHALFKHGETVIKNTIAIVQENSVSTIIIKILFYKVSVWEPNPHFHEIDLRDLSDSIVRKFLGKLFHCEAAL